MINSIFLLKKISASMVRFSLFYLLMQQPVVAQTQAQSSEGGGLDASGDQGSLNNYKLVPGDRISIEVFGEPVLTVVAQLAEDGTFNYPFLGRMNGVGQTVADVQLIIEKELREGYLVDPKVNVTMDTFREIYVSGEVVRGGNFPFQTGLSVSKAIVLAGGFTERAAKNRIRVVSEDSDSSKGVIVDLDYILKPGDIITVSRRFF